MKLKKNPMKNVPMFKTYDEENDWEWSLFTDALCMRPNNDNGVQETYGKWYHHGEDLPSREQIETLTCREYTMCSVNNIAISDDRISKTCEPFDEERKSPGCKRLCILKTRYKTLTPFQDFI